MGRSSSHSTIRVNPFTLIEMFVVISLLAVTASFFTFRMKDLLDQSHFSSDIESLSSHLYSAKTAALLMDIDLKITLEMKDKEAFFMISSLDPSFSLPLPLQKPKILKSIKNVISHEGDAIFYGHALNCSFFEWKLVDKRGKSAKIKIDPFGKIEVIV